MTSEFISLGSNKHPGGNTNGRRCLCQHPKTTCLSPGCLPAPATSSVSCLRINLAPDLLVKLYQCELKVCVLELVFCSTHLFYNLCAHKKCPLVFFIQRCLQISLKLPHLSWPWILPRSCQLIVPNKGFSSSGCLQRLQFLH